MFEPGSRVLYGMHGVCVVAAVEPMRFGKQKGLYYVLEPLSQPGARFYVPAENAAAVAKLRPILTREEILQLLRSEEVKKDVWIGDENLRKQRYKQLLAGSDRGELMCMMHTLYIHRQNQLTAGRKFHQCDENFLHDAERILHTEFALVMELDPEQVVPFIKEQMGVA